MIQTLARQVAGNKHHVDFAMHCRLHAELFVLFACTSSALAVPYIPKSDAQVLERLPFKPSDPVARELAQLRATLRRDPRNLNAAVVLAGRCYGLVGEEGDPRYLGYAQAALAPWWNMPAPPVEVQVLRASLRQFRHDFAGAVDDLNQVLVREPRHVRALALGITDTFLLASYADLLLDQKRYKDVVALLKDRSRSDVLLLRIVFAERALGASTAKEREGELAARYAAAQMRGEQVHQQEEARFALQVRNDATRALALAQENWQAQREPRDARIFLEAAVAMKDAGAALPVLQWLDDSGIEDRYLRDLGQRLKELRK